MDLRVLSVFLAGLSYHLVLAVDNSQYFSQFVGAATATFSGPSSQSVYFPICTNYIHGLIDPNTLPTTASVQIFQEQVDGVCQICSKLDMTRIDSCCAQATSSACFQNFDAAAATTTADGHSAASTGSAGSGTSTAAATGTAVAAGPTKSSNANKIDMINFPGSLSLALLGMFL
ncbi:hypothetical protein BGW36DRAFT_466516 [Talaromyces proteolyticus]|uniref:Uncharacterized protein n=1 Tax=Talaromyces proteolyticus TaxID=1131652 RepID=A0AAD4KJG1_9EURO|nr:uncharacterized protein BGW36DRAFT_466516 [Talaromyces proteolyticus]KAH8689678.1 hypothetical protein BGW36DRAFT_466516 [Talaromyces proteolyticus]